MNESLELARGLVEQPYAWPGGYPRFAITRDYGCLCKKCVKDELALIEVASEDDDAQWEVIALEINWEDDSLHCDHCGERIESAYAEA
jgi:hypothetical protein